MREKGKNVTPGFSTFAQKMQLNYLWGMFMTIESYAGFIGLKKRRLQQLIKAGRFEGLIALNSRVRFIDTDKARIKPNFNFERRTTGSPIGRSKQLRGEPGFNPK